MAKLYYQSKDRPLVKKQAAVYFEQLGEAEGVRKAFESYRQASALTARQQRLWLILSGIINVGLILWRLISG